MSDHPTRLIAITARYGAMSMRACEKERSVYLRSTGQLTSKAGRSDLGSRSVILAILLGDLLQHCRVASK